MQSQCVTELQVFRDSPSLNPFPGPTIQLPKNPTAVLSEAMASIWGSGTHMLGKDFQFQEACPEEADRAVRWR